MQSIFIKLLAIAAWCGADNTTCKVKTFDCLLGKTTETQINGCFLDGQRSPATVIVRDEIAELVKICDEEGIECVMVGGEEYGEKRKDKRNRKKEMGSKGKNAIRDSGKTSK